jgi:hypothetical protein
MSIDKLIIPTRTYGEATPVAPDTNAEVAKINELVDAVNAGLATSNAIVGGPKYVRYTSSQYYGVPAEALTLDRLDPSTILPGNLATVINPAPRPLTSTVASQQYVATIVPADTAGALQVPAYSGAPAGTTVAISWQLVSSADSFTKLLASELPAGKEQFAGLDLRPLLIAIIGALGSANTITTQPAPTAQPLAPTSGVVDDVADTFSFLPVAAYPAFSQYKVAGLPGVTGAVVLDATNSYVQTGRVYVKVVGAVPTGGLSVYVAGSGTVPDGKPLLSNAPFTGVVVPANTAPVVTLTVAGTASVPRFTAKATDSDGIQGIGVNVYDAASDELVQTFGPSVAGNTQYVTSWAAATPGDYYAQAVATDTKNLVGQSDQVPFTVVAAAITPDAPTVVYTSATRKLTATDKVSPAGKLLFSFQGSAFVEYIGAIQVDDLGHDPGEWQFKRAASTGYNESAPASSPAIAPKAAVTQQVVRFTFVDSKTRGYLLDAPLADCWPAQETALLPADYAEYHNMAKDGWQVGPESFESSFLAHQVPDAIAIYNTLDASKVRLIHNFVWGGHNDGNYLRTVDDVFADLKTGNDRLKAAGAAKGIEVRCSGATLDPDARAYGTATIEQNAAFVQAFNARFLVEYESLGFYNIFNNASDSRKLNVFDTTYFIDKQHETKLGQAVNARNYAAITLATCTGQKLAPAPSLVANSATPTLDTSLTGAPVVFTELTNVTLSTDGKVITDQVAAGGPTVGGGFNAFAASKKGIGASTALVLGWLQYTIKHAQGEFLASLNTLLTDFASQQADLTNVNNAWHLNTVTQNYVRPFGTGSTATGNNDAGALTFVDGDVLRIQRESTRIVWFKNSTPVLIFANNDITSTFWPEFLLKGLNSYVENVVIAAANLVDRPVPTPTVGAPFSRTFSTLTAGRLDRQDGWLDFTSDKGFTISSGGLAIPASASYDKSDKRALRTGIYTDGSVRVLVDATAPTALLQWHFDQATNKTIGLYCIADGNGGYFLDAQFFQGSYLTPLSGAPKNVLYKPTGTNFWMDISVSGNVIKMKAWADGTDENAAAVYTYTLTGTEGLGAGQVGLGCITNSARVLQLIVY